ncbi:MAG TPA: efflux RND transporter periplasmic adaptor subunit [Thermoanaerobaculia bacterium]|nr:efflux RND transporter periplasmic adaptor subunit [Thermoanaerobaculia bacterium]
MTGRCISVIGWVTLALAACNRAPAGRWVAVERAELGGGVEIQGQLRAEESAFLGPPQVSGVWDYKVAFLVPEGTEVRAGEPVIAFDTSELERQAEERREESRKAATELEKKQADLGRERADLALRRAEAEAREARLRLEVTVPPDLVAALEKDKAIIDHRLAEAEVAFLRAQEVLLERRARAEMGALEDGRRRAVERVAELEAAIDRMTVVAPRSGTVIYAGGDFEDKVKLGDSVWMGRTVIEIPSLERLLAEASIDEADAGRVAPGQTARLRLDADPDATYVGRVIRIGNAVDWQRRGSSARVISVLLELEAGAGRKARPGMRLTGTIVPTTATLPLSVPMAAVLDGAPGPRLLRRSRFGSEPVAVTLGRFGSERVEVLAGVAEGEKVLVPAAGGGR